jgi:hypothetical protein
MMSNQVIIVKSKKKYTFYKVKQSEFSNNGCLNYLTVL